jgi:hypothetical protein
MSFPDIMIFIAGLLQFVVAGYALRLNRLFGSARVGWSLFWAFMLLALLHLVQFAVSFHDAGAASFGNEIAVMYALISLLLLIGMMHLETVLKERIKREQQEHAMRTELELEVKKKTAYLTRAIEGLQAEIDERKRMEAEVETTHIELRAVTRQAEMARLATDVLQRVGDMIQSVNASVGLVSDQVKQSKIANVVRVGELIRQHTADLGKFMANDPRGQKLPVYIAQLAEHLGGEQANLLNELASLKANLENVLTTQQDFARLAGVRHSAEVTAMIQESLNQHDELMPEYEPSKANRLDEVEVE